MVSFAQIQAAQPHSSEYACLDNLNLYDAPDLKTLATQAVVGRQLRVIDAPNPQAIQVQLCEDDYPGWLATEDLDLIELAEQPYRAQPVATDQIQRCLPQVMTYCQQAMQQPNYYLWGGTVGPNYDCSGLIQAGFMASGLWLPRDAYQQEAFVQPVEPAALQPGDLIFFGTPNRATHVGLHLGDGYYIHSSGKAQGRNGIGIDQLLDMNNLEVTDPVSQAYMQQLRGAGRVVASYMPVSDGAI